MATLRSLANNRASEATDNAVYGRVTTHTKAHQAHKRRNSEELIIEERAIWPAAQLL